MHRHVIIVIAMIIDMIIIIITIAMITDMIIIVIEYHDTHPLQVFAAVLRNSSIPCRVMYGRKSQPKVQGEILKWHSGSNPDAEDEKFHTQAQFFSPTVGWIPVNVSKVTVHNVVDG